MKRRGRVLVCSLSTSLTGWYSDISIAIKSHISIMINTSISIRSTAGGSTGERAGDNSRRESERTKSNVYMWRKNECMKIDNVFFFLPLSQLLTASALSTPS